MKRLILLLVAVLLTFNLVSAQAAAPIRIGLVQLGTDNAFWIAQVAGGKKPRVAMALN
jgi:ABC-type sugar transport system substrate-binding protein